MTGGLVLSTRPDGLDDPLVGELRAAGVLVLAVPTVAVRAADPGGPLHRAVERAADWDWVVVTSRRGVEALAGAALQSPGASPLRAWRARWAAVGEGTAEALAREGITEALVPTGHGSGAVAAALAARTDLHDRRVLLPRANAADSALPEQLTGLGAWVRDVVAYTTVIGPATSAAPLAAVLANPGLALAVVASGSAVRGLVSLAERAGPVESARVRTLALVSIGPSTSATVARLGLRLVGEAERPTVAGLVAAVVTALARADVHATTGAGAT